ncbi:MAG: choice-of-anchor J domain-containing protein, partial [Bacteroidales bacterium]|nr:choice-of-anchor J domain-containing protein [Bacteroidales bacterium]
VDADGDGYNWDPTFLRDRVDDESGEGYCHNGSYGMISSASYINNVGALTPDNWLISPGITIPANYYTATLSWYAKGQDAGYAEEYYAVYVSTNGANIGNFNTTLYEGETTGDWIQHTANLSAYAGQTIRIAFRHYNVTDMFWLDLDDISVTGTVGVEDHELSASIYPNPANNVLNINANCNINNVAVYNMMGQMVASYNVNDMNTQISTVNLANGVYTVKISTENGMSTQRFTVVR